MIELSALGSGRVLLDDHGITRERLLRGTQTIGWDEIETYHLTMEAGVEGGGLFDDLNPIGLLLDGELRIGAGELLWAGEPPLSLDEVEAIEFFNSSPVCVRVMKHGKVLPYAKGRLAEIGNVVEVLEVARELGYPVRGIELFDDLRSAGL